MNRQGESHASGMTPHSLRNTLQPLQEAKGYYFNRDDSMTMELLEQLLVTKARYGYMACPCRLANGTYEADKDIICPCSYREQDVNEFEACFCGLYVSKEWNERWDQEQQSTPVVPDRRDPGNILL